MIQRIKSKNNVFQHPMVLKTNRKKRHRAGEFLVEGVRSIKMAVANRWKIRSFVFVEGNLGTIIRSCDALVFQSQNHWNDSTWRAVINSRGFHNTDGPSYWE